MLSGYLPIGVLALLRDAADVTANEMSRFWTSEPRLMETAARRSGYRTLR